MQQIYDAMAWIMKQCYTLCGNYGVAVILFTFITKIILLPVSVWVQKNSIKMVKIQPDINFLKVRHFGDADAIAEGQNKLFRQAGYHPLASIVPTVIQLVLLMAVIAAIKAGMADSSIDMRFLGVDLSLIPAQGRGWLILSPIAAGASAWLMCAAQNQSNVLQAEQDNWNKYGMLILSVGLSLYLGWFVSVGVALYWVASNLFSIAQLYLLNMAIDPKKYVDYARLEESKKQLSELQQLGGKRHGREARELARRERADYKRFFSVLNKHLVFYSESSGFYKYYKGIIEYILKNTNIAVHYITSDPNDQVFAISQSQPRLKPYYIAEKRLITLMMKLDCDVMVMTMPDIENFHIKRSYVRKDIEYVYVPHCIDSINMTMRTGAVDHYDSVLCVGKHQKEEITNTEAVYGLPHKTLVDWGYTLLDEMRAQYAASAHEDKPGKKILIAPSWQKDNIVDSCLEEILDTLKGRGYQITVRPHPQEVRLNQAYMEQLEAKYAADRDVEIQTDFSSNSTVFEADLLITDWSGITYEYAFTTLRPVLFIDTPMKVMNPEYEKINTPPINIWMREVIGAVVKPDELEKLPEAVERLLSGRDEYRERIDRFVHEYVYNLGNSGEVGAKYIINEIQKKIKERKNSQQ